MNFSQALGVIGYSLLPMTIVGLIVPAVQGLHYVAMVFKVSSGLVFTFISFLRINRRNFSDYTGLSKDNTNILDTVNMNQTGSSDIFLWLTNMECP